MYETIPDELKKLKRFVCWTGDKLPKNPKTGANAQSNNPNTWGTFAQAVKAVETFHFDGIGFMFAPPYFGVDLDHCLDKQDFVDEFVDGLQSYNEISRSGNGIHIICKGVLPEGRRRDGGVEMYSEGRYFIMTGNPYNTDYPEVTDCTERIKTLHAKYLPTITPAVAPKEVVRLEMTDEEVIDKARSCKTGNLFQLLYMGHWEGLYPSQSEADMAFCNQLAFWTQKDEQQMDRIFRNSGLMRQKWDRQQAGTTYGAITIGRACLSCKEVYEPQIVKDETSLAIGMFGEKRVEQSAKNSYEMTDTGNAQRFHDKYKGQIRYSYNRKRWYYWTGKKWQLDDVGNIKVLADDILNDLKAEAYCCDDEDMQKQMLKWANRTANSTGKKAMIEEAQHLGEIPVLPDQMDSYSDYINCQNGIVNLRNGELIPHSPEFMMTKITNCEYDTAGRKPERWLEFLDDVTGGDKELQRYLQKCIGYSLTGLTVEHCCFFLYGMGRNGKSTFIDTLANMIGDYASNTQPDTIMMRQNSGGANSDIARLKSARLVTCAEPTEGMRLNEGLLKQLTGGDKVTCRYLYGDEFEYEPEFKIWVATNHKPVVRGTDNGIWRRLRLIPFEYVVPEEKVDKNLKFKLGAEMPQIMRWAVDGCIAYKQEGLGLPKCVQQATTEYKAEMDIVATFMDEAVEITNRQEDTLTAMQLYEIYKAWAKENNEYEMKSKKFFMEMGNKLPYKKRTSAGIVYGGFVLTEFGNRYRNDWRFA